ncbi:hypothetical protein LUD75_01755 [Epilithonimonas sp. JDS]|uniref:hypothetical protein n=1 Tax=Epilithonimonas sp. JDS TaxID=2902797 RepID=UPI001E5266D7|nr:hypothetical protein [Epilithonimonas sp. JDS]MCD9853412.1 hypothetical protein [Epilithonimonas sp. JDS]
MRKFILILFSISLFSCKNEKEKNTNTNIQNEKIPIATKIQNPKAELENEIIKLIKAFKTKDEKALNSYIDTNIGFYLIPGPGTLLNFKKTNEISTFVLRFFARTQSPETLAEIFPNKTQKQYGNRRSANN